MIAKIIVCVILGLTSVSAYAQSIQIGSFDTTGGSGHAMTVVAGSVDDTGTGVLTVYDPDEPSREYDLTIKNGLVTGSGISPPFNNEGKPRRPGYYRGWRLKILDTLEPAQ